MAVLYFNRATGTAFVCDADYEDQLRESLGDALNKCERISAGHGAIKVKALADGHLDVTTLADRHILAG